MSTTSIFHWQWYSPSAVRLIQIFTSMWEAVNIVLVYIYIFERYMKIHLYSKWTGSPRPQGTIRGSVYKARGSIEADTDRKVHSAL